MTYSEQQLLSMLSDLESDIVERKESFKGDSPNSVREAVCAFANDLPDHRRDGVIFVGAKDDGSTSGLPITDDLLRQLSDIKTDGNILPPPTLSVAKHNLRGAEIAVVIVRPADSPPVRYKGRVHIRIGPRRGIASAQDERILNEKRRYKDLPYDLHPMASARLTDLNKVSFETDYLPKAVAPDILAENDRSYEQRLAVTKMIVTADEPTPTVLGLLTIGVRPLEFLPGAYIQFLRIAGRTHADPIIDAARIEGPITEIFRRIDDKLISHNRVAIDFTSGPTEIRRQLYPVVALQQLVRNAVMHRSYETTNAPIHVYWFDDRIEIRNPGGAFGAVTRETFGEPGVIDYRNPNLAEALRVMGLVQRFGVGIQIARRELDKNGNPPPSFEVTSSHVFARIGVSPSAQQAQLN